jgi:hypothetical protein
MPKKCGKKYLSFFKNQLILERQKKLSTILLYTLLLYYNKYVPQLDFFWWKKSMKNKTRNKIKKEKVS